MSVTKTQAVKAANFLRGWSKGKIITKSEGAWHKSGKWVTKISPQMVKALFRYNLVEGQPQQFTVKEKTS